ncbi:MAG: hypothetical protein ABFE08_15095 [Armatimonadia bacterium]
MCYRPLLLALLLLLLLPATLAQAKVEYAYDMQWGGVGTADGQMEEPMGVYVRGDRIIVADKSNCRVQVFGLDGNFICKFGGPSFGSGTTGLSTPAFALLDNLLNIYVLDTGNWRIVKLNSVAQYQSEWGSEGTGVGQFSVSVGMAIDAANDYIYLADQLNHRIIKFTTGTYPTLPGGGHYVMSFGSQGTGNGQFDRPCAIAVDDSGYVYVADTCNNRIQKFSSTGVYQTAWDGSAGGGTLYYPQGLCTAGTNVFVADTTHNMIKKYDNQGNFQMSFGTYGSGKGQFNDPCAVAVDSLGRVYVADRVNDRIQRFVLNGVPTAPTDVVIKPGAPRDDQSLSCRVTGGSDPDGDPLTYDYRWYSSWNRTTWTAGGSAATVGSLATSARQYWRVSVRCNDGHSVSPWRWSLPVKIRLTDLGNFGVIAPPSVKQAVSLQVNLPDAAVVSGQLRNMAGIVVAQLPRRELPAGQNTLCMPVRRADGTKLPSGQYLLTVSAAATGGELYSQVVPVSIR